MDLTQEEDNVLDVDTNYNTPQASSDNKINEVSSTDDNPFEVEPAGL